MTEFVLIHGYGSGINYAKFSDDRKAHLGFSGFHQRIKDDRIKMFSWFLEQKWSLIDVLNPIKHLKLYEKERKEAARHETLEKFDQFLKANEPKSIVCHSMGAKLLANYLDKYPLPEFIKSLILIQADIPHNQALQQRGREDLAIYNLYCPWDPTLLLSIPYNLYLPAGIVGLKEATRNLYLPLLGSYHLHVASIRNKNIVEILEAL